MTESLSISSDSSGTCSIHGDSVVYYCRDCRVTVCATCVTDRSHRKHEFETLKKGVELHIEAVTERVKNIKNSMKKQTNIKCQVIKARNELQDTFNLAKENVAEQFRELRELMDQNMQQAFLLILALRETMIQDMDQLVEFGEKYEEKSNHIQSSVKALKRTHDTDDGAIISKIEEMEMGIEEIEDYHKKVLEVITMDDRRLKALQHSISRIVKINKDLLPRPWEFGENITFNDATSHERLRISGDKIKVQSSKKGKQMETVFNVLASQSFTEGSHYWEVNVKNTECWTVGVVEKDWVKKGIKQALGQDKLSWVLQMDGDSLVAMHKKDTTMITEAVIERLGVFLDFKKGRLQFFNVHRGTVLHTFVEKFKNPLFPAFSIESQKGSTPEMRLCALMPGDMDTNYGANERRISTDSGIWRAVNTLTSASQQSLNESTEDSQSIESATNDVSHASDQDSGNKHCSEVL